MIRLLLGVLVVAVVVLALRSLMARRERDRVLGTGTPVDDDDPLMHEAMRDARAGIGRLRDLSARASDAWIKFAAHTPQGDVEHVWGSLEAVEDDSVLVAWRMPVGVGRDADRPGRRKLALDEVEDWQVTLPDGAIHGGYTTRAQIAIARRDGYPIPDAVLDQERRFVDPPSLPTSHGRP